MRRANKSAADNRAARRIGEFARSVRRNLRQAHRISERAEQAAQRCYGKAGAAMLEAKTNLAMSEETFAVWLTSFGLSQERLGQCLELGQIALDRRKADAAAREQSFRTILAEKLDISRETTGPEDKPWPRQPETAAAEVNATGRK
jgi:hypothetical protein